MVRTLNMTFKEISKQVASWITYISLNNMVVGALKYSSLAMKRKENIMHVLHQAQCQTKSKKNESKVEIPTPIAYANATYYDTGSA